jgi:ubiquinone/menaquinone biosynthesis C-methylase UbiE
VDNTEFLSIEKKFHDDHADMLNWDEETTEFLSYEDEALLPAERYFIQVLGDVRGKKILDVGSGHGNCALNLAKWGAQVTSIDISPKMIEGCRKRAAKLNVSVDFQVMNAENLAFQDREFDLVVGFRTIHHLPDIGRFYREAYRVLKISGAMVLVEPQKYNPFVEFGRRFIKPKDRTSTEHPLIPADIKSAREVFGNIQADYFIFLSVLSLVFRDIVHVGFLYKFTLLVLKQVDRAILKIVPFSRMFYWQVVMKCSKN